MKIATTGLQVPEGKRKYDDSIFTHFVAQFQPEKQSPYYFEFMPDAYEPAQIIAVHADQILDVLILDIEKIENRLSRTPPDDEKAALELCMAGLENQTPACDVPMDDGARALVSALGLLSMKPVVVCESASPDPDELCRQGMDKAGMMFFYTVGKQEVHAWLVEKASDAVTCAGKIHSDLARGFIKAEIVSCKDMMTAHNMQDARTKGLTQLVDRDYPIEPETVLDIRFNV